MTALVAAAVAAEQADPASRRLAAAAAPQLHLGAAAEAQQAVGAASPQPLQPRGTRRRALGGAVWDGARQLRHHRCGQARGEAGHARPLPRRPPCRAGLAMPPCDACGGPCPVPACSGEPRTGGLLLFCPVCVWGHPSGGVWRRRGGPAAPQHHRVLPRGCVAGVGVLQTALCRRAAGGPLRAGARLASQAAAAPPAGDPARGWSAEFAFKTAPLTGGAVAFPYRLGLVGDLGQTDHSLRCTGEAQGAWRRQTWPACSVQQSRWFAGSASRRPLAPPPAPSRGPACVSPPAARPLPAAPWSTSTSAPLTV